MFILSIVICFFSFVYGFKSQIITDPAEYGLRQNGLRKRYPVSPRKSFRHLQESTFKYGEGGVAPVFPIPSPLPRYGKALKLKDEFEIYSEAKKTPKTKIAVAKKTTSKPTVPAIPLPTIDELITSTQTRDVIPTETIDISSVSTKETYDSRCGSSWVKANALCGKSCAFNNDCNDGDECFHSLEISCSPTEESDDTSTDSKDPFAEVSLTSRCGNTREEANSMCVSVCSSAHGHHCITGQCFHNLEFSCTSRCGRDWKHANAKCGQQCILNGDKDCPSGEKCFDNMDNACNSTAKFGAIKPIPVKDLAEDQTETQVIPAVDDEKPEIDEEVQHERPVMRKKNIISRCGSTWAKANTKCGSVCTLNIDFGCPKGETCFDNIEKSCTQIDKLRNSVTNSVKSDITDSPSLPRKSPKVKHIISASVPPKIQSIGTMTELEDSKKPLSPLKDAKKNPVTSNPDSVNKQTNTSRCGPTRIKANSKCGKDCTLNGDFDCSGGETCFDDLEKSCTRKDKPPTNSASASTKKQSAASQKEKPNSLLFDSSSNSNISSRNELPSPLSFDSNLKSISSRCGTTWVIANTECGSSCLLDSDCRITGEKCFGGLEISCSQKNTSLFSTATSAPSSSNASRCGLTWANANKNCGSLCVLDVNCGHGEKCFANLENPCLQKSISNAAVSQKSTRLLSNSTRCGSSWADANIKCGELCVLDSDCIVGESCFIDLEDSCNQIGAMLSSVNVSNSSRCGTSWAIANKKCGTPCYSDAGCDGGEKCFDNISCGNDKAISISKPSVTATQLSRCGSTWQNANSKCGASCTLDHSCYDGEKCFGNLDLFSCVQR